MNEFLNNLKESLSSSGVNDYKIDSILKSYKSYFEDGKRKGLSEKELVKKIEPLRMCVNTFSPKKEIFTNTEDASVIKRKKPLIVMMFNLIFLLIVNLISVPISLVLFLVLFCLFLVPIIATVTSVGILLYGSIIVNGYELVLSTLTRFTLPVGIIGLSVFVFIIICILFNRFFKVTAWYYSLQSNLLRRYK